MQMGENTMLYRKIESFIRNHLESKNNKILLIEGARQIGKTYIIRKGKCIQSCLARLSEAIRVRPR